ncbi:MAG: dihydropteroate synthase [Bacteroidales bacterium]|nr:dihydropteroate synthase [Bacteroidales bacterium]
MMNNISEQYSINVSGNLVSFERPLVMGILNITKDSFFDGGKYNNFDSAIKRAEEIINDGANILDIGACSTRPGAMLVDKKKEIERLVPVVKEVRKRYPNIIISIDTVWGEVIERCYDAGANILNDVSGGEWDNDLFSSLKKLQIPYVLMHTNAKPDRMQNEICYNDIFMDICKYFSEKLKVLYDIGVKDIILDLGFGFGKTIEQNYELLQRQNEFKTIFNLPILTGVSRKSMIYKYLNLKSQDIVTETAFIHALALERGADILRVHDVKQTKNCVKLYTLFNKK